MKEIIKKISVLKSIKADEGFKFDLRKKVLAEIGPVTTVPVARRYQIQGMSTLQFMRSNFTNMILPLLIIVSLLGGGAGATYASQSSLPGEVLYPVKLVTERAQVALTVDDAREAALHLKFSSKRLEEVEELAHEGKKDPKLVKLAVENYKTELIHAQTVLSGTATSSAQSLQIAQNVADAIAQNRAIIARVSKEFDEDEDDEVLDLLEEMWEEAVEHNDTATMKLLFRNIIASATTTPVIVPPVATSTVATSTTTTVADAGLRVKVLNKIAESIHKITESERYIAKKEAQGLNVVDAKTQVMAAKALVVEAENLLSQNKYSEAFLKAKEAHRTAKDAKDFAEHAYKEERHEGKDKDDRIMFEIVSFIGGPASTTVMIPTKYDDDKDDDNEDRDGDRNNDNEDRDSDRDGDNNDNEDKDGDRDNDDDRRR